MLIPDHAGEQRDHHETLEPLPRVGSNERGRKDERDHRHRERVNVCDRDHFGKALGVLKRSLITAIVQERTRRCHTRSYVDLKRSHAKSHDSEQ